VLRGVALQARPDWAGLVGPAAVSNAVLDQGAAEQWAGLAAAPPAGEGFAAAAAQWARRVSVIGRDRAVAEPGVAEVEWVNPEQRSG
jgi:hypothetical protein